MPNCLFSSLNAIRVATLLRRSQIQLLVCCVSDGAAEEAGLQVGDYVLAVNGTDVTMVPHTEAADLARQGRMDTQTTLLLHFSRTRF